MYIKPRVKIKSKLFTLDKAYSTSVLHAQNLRHAVKMLIQPEVKLNAMLTSTL